MAGCFREIVTEPGTNTIRIQGVENPGGARYTVLRDRIESGTYLVSGATTGGRICINRCRRHHRNRVRKPLHSCPALELQRIGAELSVEGNMVISRGVTNLTGAPVMATDLRASASLVLAGLAATGRTIIDPHLPHRPRLRTHRANALPVTRPNSTVVWLD